MRVAVIAPEYFPGLATAALVAAADVAVLADTTRYVRQSGQNRARLRTPDGVQWITIPVGHGQHGRRIAEMEIRENEPWRRAHLKALQFNYGATPYFEHYFMRIEALLSMPAASLADVTVASTRLLAELMGARPRWVRSSELPGSPGDLAAILGVLDSGRLVLTGDVVVPGGAAPSGTDRFRFRAPEYRQRFPGFRPGCSVLDMLLMHGPETRHMLLSGVEF
jgi:hypothetical protein